MYCLLRNNLTSLLPWMCHKKIFGSVQCYTQVGFLGRRIRVWGARYLSKMHTYERKEEASLCKRKSQLSCRFNKVRVNPKGDTGAKYYPSRVTFIKPKLLGLPYLLASLCLWVWSCSRNDMSWRGLCQLSQPSGGDSSASSAL